MNDQSTVSNEINANSLSDNNNNNDPIIDDNEWETQRDASKRLGDIAFQKGDYEYAIQHYTEALSIDPDYAALLSNRSAAYLLTSQKSKALYDAEQCVIIGTMGNKGISRLAAALQSLNRYQQSLEQWDKILINDPNHTAALKGKQDCTNALMLSSSIRNQQQEQQEEDEEPQPPMNDSEKTNNSNNNKKDDPEDDLLDDFFNDVQEVTKQVIQAKEEVDIDLQPPPTNAIKNHKKDLGTAQSQIERILPNNNNNLNFWYSLNPFHVLNVSHKDTIEDISRRYKALSLLLHPDKNPGLDRAQEAYDEVLKAKAILLSGDENKINFMRALVEQGMLQGKSQWDKASSIEKKQSSSSLDEYQSKAVMKIFADIEQKRRQVDKNELKHRQREQQQEDEVLQKERNTRVFEKNWQEENRVDKRVGNWHNFNEKKITKKKS